MAGAGAWQTGRPSRFCYWDEGRDTIFMLYLYSKQEQEDLTAEQVRQLGCVIREGLR